MASAAELPDGWSMAARTPRCRSAPPTHGTMDVLTSADRRARWPAVGIAMRLRLAGAVLLCGVTFARAGHVRVVD